MAVHRIGLLVGSALLAVACSSPTKSTTKETGLAGLTVTPSSIEAGGSAQGVVMLVSAAPAGGAAVSLSSNAGWVSVPATVTIPAGSTSANFTATTSSIDATTVASISASYGNTKVTTSLTVTPVAKAIASLTISPSAVTGGNASQGTITLSSSAPSSGATVALSSNNLFAATVPSTVMIPAGATSANFTIVTSSMSSPADVTIVAAYGGASKTATLTVMPQATMLMALNVTPSTVTGGQSAQAMVMLSSPAGPGGAYISLSSSTAAVNVPSVVIVTAAATSATFTITTSAVTSPANVLIGASYSGTTRTATLQVNP